MTTLGSAYTWYQEDVSSSGTVLYGQIQFSNSNPITSATDLKTVGLFSRSIVPPLLTVVEVALLALVNSESHHF